MSGLAAARSAIFSFFVSFRFLSDLLESLPERTRTRVSPLALNRHTKPSRSNSVRPSTRVHSGPHIPPGLPHQDFRMSADHRRVVRLCRFGHIRVRPLLQLEIPIPSMPRTSVAQSWVPATCRHKSANSGSRNQFGAYPTDLARIHGSTGRDAATSHRRSAPMSRRRAIDIDHDFLASAEKVFRTECISMWYLRHSV